MRQLLANPDIRFSCDVFCKLHLAYVKGKPGLCLSFYCIWQALLFAVYVCLRQNRDRRSCLLSKLLILKMTMSMPLLHLPSFDSSCFFVLVIGQRQQMLAAVSSQTQKVVWLKHAVLPEEFELPINLLSQVSSQRFRSGSLA